MKLQGIFITPIFTTEIEKDYNLVEKLYDLKNTIKFSNHYA